MGKWPPSGDIVVGMISHHLFGGSVTWFERICKVIRSICEDSRAWARLALRNICNAPPAYLQTHSALAHACLASSFVDRSDVRVGEMTTFGGSCFSPRKGIPRGEREVGVRGQRASEVRTTQ